MIKNFFLIFRLIIILLLVGCGLNDNEATPSLIVETPTNTLPDPFISTSKVPDAEAFAELFLSEWENENYSGMYELISRVAQSEISEEDFIKRYSDFAAEYALLGLENTILSSKLNPEKGQVIFDTTYRSSIFSDMDRSHGMELILEDNEWRVLWDEALVLPEFSGGKSLKRDVEYIPRANIYDSTEEVLASQEEAVAVGVWTDYVFLDESKGLLSYLAQISGQRVDALIEQVENSVPGTYLPIAELGTEQFSNIINALSGYRGVEIGRYTSRYYPDGGIAPHAVGYISAIQEAEVDEYRQLGYQSHEKVGRDGIEEWGEPYLGGERGGSLYLIDSDGKIIDELDSTPSQPAEDIYTNINRQFQQQVQDSIDGLRGAVVVLERDTGKVIAMASSPKYNPNGFQTENINWDSWLGEIYSDPNNPLINRTSQGQYPLGSVFKIITMAAALESELYTEETTYECGYFFNEALGLDLHDWTYDWFLEDGETPPSGLLTLPQGLIRSCNPFFWHIGLDLYEEGLTTAVSDMAKGFGLGTPTGIIGVPEEPGNVPDPNEPVDAINLAIGQGELLVTPLQVAQFVAALGNGGTIFQPWILDRVVNQGGNETQIFGPEVSSELPVSDENLKIIQDAMKGVVFSRDPRGTAEKVFRGFDIPIAGKTGTAESGSLDPHAWFVGYSLAEWENKPDIAVVVLVENSGEGSEWAAPIFRRIMEYYFIGTPQRLYPWEAAVGVTKTPTPLFSETPTPGP